MTGVEDNKVCILGPLGFGVALCSERLGDALAVIDVHLAAERLDVNFLLCGHQLMYRPLWARFSAVRLVP
jgi:hypothetical protein